MKSIFLTLLLAFTSAHAGDAPYRLSMSMGTGVYALYRCLLPSPELKTLICISDDGRDSFKFEMREEKVDLNPGQWAVKPNPNAAPKTIGKVVGSLSGAKIEAFGIDFWSLVKNPKKLGVCAEFATHTFMQKGTFMGDREVTQSTHVCIKNLEAVESEEGCKKAAASEAAHRASPVLYNLGRIEIDYQATTVTSRSDILGQYAVTLKTKESPARELHFLALAKVAEYKDISYCNIEDIQ